MCSRPRSAPGPRPLPHATRSRTWFRTRPRPRARAPSAAAAPLGLRSTEPLGALDLRATVLRQPAAPFGDANNFSPNSRSSSPQISSARRQSPWLAAPRSSRQIIETIPPPKRPKRPPQIARKSRRRIPRRAHAFDPTSNAVGRSWTVRRCNPRGLAPRMPRWGSPHRRFQATH